jgi:hypothetical protein
MLAQPNARLTSKALFFLHYLFTASSERCDAEMHESMVACASSDDMVVRLATCMPCPRCCFAVVHRRMRAARTGSR